MNNENHEAVRSDRIKFHGTGESWHPMITEQTSAISHTLSCDRQYHCQSCGDNQKGCHQVAPDAVSPKT